MKMNHDWSPIPRELCRVWSKTWRRLRGFTSRIILLSGVHGVFDATYASKKTGARSLSALCLRSTDEAENRIHGAVVQKRSVVWKSPPDSGTVDSDWYGLCFNLAQSALHSSWHVLVCVNIEMSTSVWSTCVCVCLVFIFACTNSPDIFVCIPHVYMRLELWNSYSPKWKRAKLLTSFTCADKFTGRLFWWLFNNINMLFILTFRVLFAICFVFKRFCVSCEP